MLDDIMVLFATKLSEYCDNRNCDGCPFAPDPTNLYGHCKVSTPAYWELKGHIDFPNSK